MRVLSEYNSELKLKGFNVFQIEEDDNATKAYSRKDFYKICLTTGKSRIHYADRSFDEEGTILFFGNPNIPYSWETLSTQYVGYTILFSEDFYTSGKHSENLQRSPKSANEPKELMIIPGAVHTDLYDKLAASVKTDRATLTVTDGQTREA